MADHLIPIPEAARRLSTSRMGIYRALAAGRLTAVKHGRRTLIRASSIDALIESLPPFVSAAAEAVDLPGSAQADLTCNPSQKQSQ